MLQALDKGEKLPTHYRAPIAVWQFGTGLTLVALSGEVVVDYVYLIEKAIGPLQVWLAAYNERRVRLPPQRARAEPRVDTKRAG